MSAVLSQHPDLDLADLVSQFRNDPLGYVRVAFPWGEPGQLQHHAGPCPCQVRIFTVLGEEIRKREFNGYTAVKPIRIAVASGHGIGKSAFFGMLVNYLMSTRPRCKGIATAGTGDQLATKTWAAIRSWKKLSITSHWFEDTTERMFFSGGRDDWFTSALTWSEEKPEAFAGQHAADSTSFYLNDECAGISDVIFEVQEGGLTDGEPMQFAFGNLTRPTGKFARIMDGRERDWITIRIDSRECPLTNKDEIQGWVEELGEDSDFVRVRYRGLPPRSALAQFISDDLIKEAQMRPLVPIFGDEPLVAGVDFAWGGDDNNTVRFRRGLDARSIPPIRIPGEFTRKPEVMVTKLAEVFERDFGGGLKVAMMFMDGAGIAGPVAIRLRQLGFRDIVEVNFNAHSLNPKYKNVRSQLYGDLKEWLIGGGCIDKSPELNDDLRSQEVLKHVPLVLKPKDVLIKEIGHSTDDGDSVGLTLYMPVRSKQVKEYRKRKPVRQMAGSYMGG